MEQQNIFFFVGFQDIKKKIETYTCKLVCFNEI